MAAPNQKPFHEQSITVKIADVRLILTVANFGVVYLDHTIPPTQTVGAYFWALLACLMFLVYAIAVRTALVRGKAYSEKFARMAPLLDILFGSALIITTGGYLSPFSVWFIFAVLGSGFSGVPRMPTLATILAIIAHLSIAMIPQELPLQLDVFLVRSCYLLGFASLVGFLGSRYASHSATLAVLESFGRSMADARTEQDCVTRFIEKARTLLGGQIGVTLDAPELEQISVDVAQEPVESFEITSTQVVLGMVTLAGRTPLSEEETNTVRLMCDRLGSALRRISLARQVADAAIQRERMRLADELHDTYLQTLAAADLFAEAARSVVAPNPQAEQEIATLKKVLRDGAERAREFIQAQQDAPTEPGPEIIRQVLKERWTGDCSVEIEPDALDAAKWPLANMLIKEAINNARKHGNSDRLRVEIKRQDGLARVRVASNGLPVPQEITFGYGLSRLDSLVREQGGMLALESGETGGAILTAIFEAEG